MHRAFLQILVAVTFSLGSVAQSTPFPDPGPSLLGISRIGQWEEIPKVLVCDDSPFSEAQVEEGMTWWQERGHRFETVSPVGRREKHICRDVWNSQPVGYIVVTRLVEAAIREADDLAVTYTLGSEHSEGLEWAKMFMRPEHLERRLLMHELGHALGFRHKSDAGHMMHPIVNSGGWDDEGLLRGFGGSVIRAGLPATFGTWAEGPTVVVCDSAPVSRHEVETAVRWWRALGHRLGDIHYKKAQLDDWQSRICRLDKPVGYIVLRLGRTDEFFERDSLAETHMFIGRKRLSYAKILFREEGQQLPRVLEHEFGHALGYKHLQEDGHLMHKKQSRGGWVARGLSVTRKTVARRVAEVVPRKKRAAKKAVPRTVARTVARTGPQFQDRQPERLLTVAPQPERLAWWLRASFAPVHDTIRGVAVAEIQPTWTRVLEFNRELFLKEGLLDSVEDSNQTFSVEGDFDEDGRQDIATVGVFLDKKGVKGNFLLILSRSADGTLSRSYLREWKAPYSEYLALDADSSESLIYWLCLECDHGAIIEWDGDRRTYVRSALFDD